MLGVSKPGSVRRRPSVAASKDQYSGDRPSRWSTLESSIPGAWKIVTKSPGFVLSKFWYREAKALNENPSRVLERKATDFTSEFTAWVKFSVKASRKTNEL